MKYPYELTRDYALKELYTKEQFEWIYISYNYCRRETFDIFMNDLRRNHMQDKAFQFLYEDDLYMTKLFDEGFYLSNKRYWSSVSTYNPNGRTYKDSIGTSRRLTDNILYANVWLLTDSYLTKSNKTFKLKL